MKMSLSQNLKENAEKVKQFLFENKGAAHPQQISMVVSQCAMMPQSASRFQQLSPEKRCSDLLTAGLSEDELWDCCDQLRVCCSNRQNNTPQPEPIKEQPVQAQQTRRGQGVARQVFSGSKTTATAGASEDESTPMISPISVDLDEWRALLVPLVSALLQMIDRLRNSSQPAERVPQAG